MNTTTTYSGARNVTRIRLCFNGWRWKHPRYPLLMRLLQIADELTCCRIGPLCHWRCKMENASEFVDHR